MAAKRLLDDSDSDPDQPNQKRPRTIKPSFASVIKEVVSMNFLQNFCSVLEPVLRRVVHEEIEEGLRRNQRSLTRAPSMRIQGIEHELPSLQLMFCRKLSLPIFTGTKITDSDTNHLQILLVDTCGGGKAGFPYPVKIEMVVLDGDFPGGGDMERWSSQEFDRNVVKERAGKRPLLAGELCVTMRDGVCSFGEIEFTDNSSWIRCRRFRLGARVVSGSPNAHQAVRIRPAMTESFVVKDHRGELYKKHYPPRLDDEVWRLEKIGKDGAFHRKLSQDGVNTVQDFLKLSVVDPPKLKKILGIGMSEKMWDVTLKHAWTCDKGTKLYVSRGSNFSIVLNPVCQVIKAVINGQIYANRDLTIINKSYIEKLVRDAYANWSHLEEIDAQLNETSLLTIGNQYTDGCQIQQVLLSDGSTSIASTKNEGAVEYNSEHQWADGSCGYLCTPLIEPAGAYFSESSPGGNFPN